MTDTERRLKQASYKLVYEHIKSIMKDIDPVGPSDRLDQLDITLDYINQRLTELGDDR